MSFGPIERLVRARHEDVRGLHVAMDDAGGMRDRQTLEQATCHAKGPREARARRAEPVHGKGQPLDQLADEPHALLVGRRARRHAPGDASSIA